MEYKPEGTQREHLGVKNAENDYDNYGDDNSDDDYEYEDEGDSEDIDDVFEDEDEDEEGDEGTESHINDEDDLVVYIDTSDVIPAAGIHLNLDSSPAAAESSAQPAKPPFEGVKIDLKSNKSKINQFRTQMKRSYTEGEKKFWYEMYKPPVRDEEHEARKVLEPQRREPKSKRRKLEERIQHAIDRGDVTGGGKSHTYEGKEQFWENLLTAEFSMYEALEKKCK
ncbi:hypothetical protein FRC12_002424 [Ceratobasidium sp. 428]|nr:hypothetical protein FRC12_002424 [Ceratobasidium sp. 428]